MRKFRLGFSVPQLYEREAFGHVIKAPEYSQLEVVYINSRISKATIHEFTNRGFDGLICFVYDELNPEILQELKDGGINAIFLRSAGFEMIDLPTCEKLGISVCRVPAYSPYSVAEFAMSSLMVLNRKIHIAYNRVRDNNFLLDGLMGRDLHGKTVGVIGTGKIGHCFINIAIGFGCKILAYDVFISEAIAKRPEVTYVELDQLLRESDFISMHAPLTPDTFHMINEKSLALMKPTCMLVNTSRGGLINSKELLKALLSHKIAGAALDVYEAEKEYYFKDCSDINLQDDVLERLINMRNVLVTGHQAFFTKEAVYGIAETTLKNCIECFIEGKRMYELTNAVRPT